jgi:hypothetical protein
MSKTVAHTLVDVLEKIGVKHIFGLIGDSLNPLADAVRHTDIEWVSVRHEEGARSRRPAKQSSLVGSASVAGQPDPAATISSPASMKQVAITPRFSRSPAICRASCRAPTIVKRQIRTCYSVMSRFTPRPFPRPHRRRP